MKPHAAVRLLASLLSLILLTCLWTFPAAGQGAMVQSTFFSSELAPGEANPKELETDRKHLLQIFEAIQAYRQKHGDLPGWLSDLVPEFLPDTNVLMSPVELRTGRSQLWGYGDPKVRSSYIYEFNQSKAGGIRDQGIPLTMKQWKMLQMEEFGPVIPLLRCHLYDFVLNLSYSGDVYQSGLFWETDTNTLALMARLGPGPGAKSGRKLRVLVRDAMGNAPVQQARVLSTNRVSELGQLPPRRSVTDAEGWCEVNLGGKLPKSVTLEVDKSGYATHSVHWTEGSAIPEEWTVSLQKAVSIGGLVLSREGKPISDAVVLVNGLMRDPVGQVIPTRCDTAKTDAEGKWTSRKIPEGFKDLSFVLSHPEFLPGEYDVVTEDTSTEDKAVTRANLLAGTAKMTLEPGILVRGTIKDEDGDPVIGAKVLLTIVEEERPYTMNAETDEKGAFHLVATHTGEATLMAQARGLAPKEHEFGVSRELEPLTIKMNKGREVSGLVLGDDDKPVAGAAISVVNWNGKAQLNWQTQTDAEGLFEWDNAPEGELILWINKDGYVRNFQQVPPNLRDKWVIRLQRPFRLVGRVLDAETGDLIKKFTLRRGFSYRVISPDDETYRWDEELSHPGDGTFDATSEDAGYGATKYAVWADGYLPCLSPRFDQPGTHSYEFKLQRGKGLGGVLQSRDGKPVEDAKLYLATAASGMYMDKPGEFRSNVTRCQSVTSDSEGRFQFEPELDAHSVFVAHEQGFAEVAVETVMATGKVVLEPWAVVRGVVKFRKPGPNQSISLHNMSYRYYAGSDGFPRLSLFMDIPPDEEGRYVFEKVPPGHRKIYVRYKFHDGPGIIPLSHGVFLDLKPGEIREVNFGQGRTIIGRVSVSGEGADEVDWTRDQHKLTPKPCAGAKPEPQPPQVSGADGEGRRAAYEEFARQQREYWTSEEGLVRQQQSTDYLLVFEEDGSFRVEGVPPGEYTLSINPTASPEEATFARRYGVLGGRAMGGLAKDIVVPEAGAAQDDPIDLGTLELKLTKPQPATNTRVINF